MEIGYITSVTITEFLVWYSTGELRLLGRRLIPVGLQPDGVPEADTVLRRQVMDLLPHVDLEDEHSVLIVTLSGGARRSASEVTFLAAPLALDATYVPAAVILSVQPLTRRGAAILQSRLQGMDVRLESPLFEDETNSLWLEWSQRRSALGAMALLELAVRGPRFRPSLGFATQALEAIRVINAQQESPPDAPLLVQVMCYNRHEPITEKDVGFFVDLGIILSHRARLVPSCLPVVDRMREFCKALQKDDRSLPELLLVPCVRDTLREYVAAQPDEIGLTAAVLFLKWKYHMQQSQHLDVEGLLADVRESSGRADSAAIEEALWVFGFFCGFDRMAHAYYVRTPRQYRFMAASVPHEPVELAVALAASPSPAQQSTDPTSPAPEEKPASSGDEATAGKDGGASGKPEPSPRIEPLPSAERTESEPGATPMAEAAKEDLLKSSKKQLRERLTTLGIQWKSSWTKDELAAAIEKASKAAEQRQFDLHPSKDDARTKE